MSVNKIIPEKVVPMGSAFYKIEEATLLSADELEECSDYIKALPDSEPICYYLRTAYDDNMVGTVDEYCEVDEIDPDYVDFPPKGPSGTGIRPVLRIDPSTAPEGWNIQAGDELSIGRWRFTAISDTLLLCDNVINWDDIEDDCACFDEETNVYEESHAKEVVDEWFENILNEIEN